MIQTSILVLAKNEAGNVQHCLDAVFSQETSSSFEVIFIDSGSTDGTVDLARKYPVKIHQITTAEFHHSRTRNLAATMASGEYLVYLAADAFPTGPQWLLSLLDNFRDESVGAVYGRHIPKPSSKMERQHALGSLYGPERIVKNRSSRERLGYRYYHFSTVNAAIRKSAWEATRFPDELRVFEDVAIAKRLLDQEWTIVYEPKAMVYHSHDYPARTLFRRYFDIGVVYNRLGIWTKGPKASVRDEGIRTVMSKFQAFRPGQVGAVGKALWCDAAKASGLLLGRNERLLPQGVKRRLSAFGLFQ